MRGILFSDQVAGTHEGSSSGDHQYLPNPCPQITPFKTKILFDRYSIRRPVCRAEVIASLLGGSSLNRFGSGVHSLFDCMV